MAGYIPGARGFDALLVGVCENEKSIFVAKVKNGFVPRIRDELVPALKAANCPMPLQKSALGFRSPSRRRKEILGGTKRHRHGNTPAGGASQGLSETL